VQGRAARYAEEGQSDQKAIRDCRNENEARLDPSSGATPSSWTRWHAVISSMSAC
jgi:hypothetical protein